MSVAVKEILRASRPPGAPGKADKYLPDIVDMDPEGCPSPSHTNMLQLAKVAGALLTERFSRLPADSFI